MIQEPTIPPRTPEPPRSAPPMPAPVDQRNWSPEELAEHEHEFNRPPIVTKAEPTPAEVRQAHFDAISGLLERNENEFRELVKNEHAPADAISNSLTAIHALRALPYTSPRVVLLPAALCRCSADGYRAW